MKWLGLTGGIGTGKSTVSKILRAEGIAVIDADEITHRLMQPSGAAFRPIIDHFGKVILDDRQAIDRKKLGGVVFSDRSQLLKLEEIIHPLVRKEVLAEQAEYESKGHKLAVYDVPLLYEKNMSDQFDEVLVVFCRPEQQIERIKKRNHWNDEEIKRRMASQVSILEKKQKADFVIDNTGSLEDLKANTLKWLKDYQAQL